MTSAHPYPPIGDYALIGDRHSAMLIAPDGSMDWFCPGRFDAPAAFCRMLDTQRGGFVRCAPSEAFSIERRYQGQTNVLETVFSTQAGRVRVTDLMPVYRRTPHRRGYDVGSSNRVLRLVEGLAGEVDLELTFKPTFDYARAATRIELRPGVGAIASWAGGQWLSLACRGVELESASPGELRSRLRLRAGQRQWCYEQLLADTLDYWRCWAADAHLPRAGRAQRAGAQVADL